MRLDIRRVGAIKVGEQSVGNRTRVKVVKNKLAPPFTECEFDVLYGEGISKSGDLLDLAVNDGILEKSGAWFSYNGERVGQGRDNARNFLQERPKLLAEIESRVLQKHGLARSGKAVDASAAEASAAPVASANGQKSSAAAAAPDNAKDKDKDKAAESSKGAAAAATAGASAKSASAAADEDAKRAAAAAANRARPRA
jgi:recombination protein RecA